MYTNHGTKVEHPKTHRDCALFLVLEDIFLLNMPMVDLRLLTSFSNVFLSFCRYLISVEQEGTPHENTEKGEKMEKQRGCEQGHGIGVGRWKMGARSYCTQPKFQMARKSRAQFQSSNLLVKHCIVPRAEPRGHKTAKR